MKHLKFTVLNRSVVATAVVAVVLFGLDHGRTGEGPSIVQAAVAAETKSPVSPVKALVGRQVYYPGTEDLGASFIEDCIKFL